jgi:hypothetical protein
MKGGKKLKDKKNKLKSKIQGESGSTNKLNLVSGWDSLLKLDEMRAMTLKEPTTKKISINKTGEV